MKYQLKEQNKYKRARELKNFLKQSGCVLCGYSKCLSALEFHHISNDKIDEINKMNTQTSILQEAKKCIVVCANCHREIHAGLIEGLVKLEINKEKINQQGELFN